MLTHRWVKGSFVNDRQLSTCTDCGALRVQCFGPPKGHKERERDAAALGIRGGSGYVVHTTEYIRPVFDSGRISAGEPPCIRPPRRPAPW